MHQAFANSRPGYEQARGFILDALRTDGFDGLDVSGEATSYYWLPYFWHLAHDPALQAHDVSLFLLNPRWVHWFKKSLPPDDKTDAGDPFYIAERTRTHRPKAAWMPLRFYTRRRSHLVQALTHEKNYYLIHLFILHSAYQRVKPFSNTFDATNQQVLNGELPFEKLADLPMDELLEYLDEWSDNHLHNPIQTALKLQQVAAQSFSLDEPLTIPLQHLLDLTLENITFLQRQIQQVEQWIIAEVHAHHPEVLLLTTSMKRPSTNTNGRWSLRLARASASSWVCYTAKKPTAQRKAETSSVFGHPAMQVPGQV